MTRRYALYGPVSRDWLTYGGRILWHTHPGELAYLVPHGATVRELPRDVPDDQCMHIRFHPAMATVRWPLNRKDFNAA